LQGWDLILVEAFVHPNNLLMSCFCSFFKRKGVSRATQTTEVDDGMQLNRLIVVSVKEKIFVN
jgi:hypothetical protein